MSEAASNASGGRGCGTPRRTPASDTAAPTRIASTRSTGRSNAPPCAREQERHHQGDAGQAQVRLERRPAAPAAPCSAANTGARGSPSSRSAIATAPAAAPTSVPTIWSRPASMRRADPRLGDDHRGDQRPVRLAEMQRVREQIGHQTPRPACAPTAAAPATSRRGARAGWAGRRPRPRSPRPPGWPARSSPRQPQAPAQPGALPCAVPPSAGTPWIGSGTQRMPSLFCTSITTEGRFWCRA